MRDNIIFAYEWNSNSWDMIQYPSRSNGTKTPTEFFVSRATINLKISKNMVPQYPLTETQPEISTMDERYSGKHFVFKKLSDIPEGTKYCYNIPIKNHDSYWIPRFRNGFNISDRVYEDAKNGNALILLDYRNEGWLKTTRLYDLDDFNNVCSKLGLPKDRVLLLHADYNTTELESDYYTYVPMNKFTSWIQHVYTEPVEYVPHKLFLSYNRALTLRYHRILLLSYLQKSNLFNRGIISTGKIGLTKDNINSQQYYINENFDSSITEKDMDIIDSLNHTSPDNFNIAHTNPAFTIIDNHYKHTFVSLVSETLYHHNINFFSEKIYKPLSIGHPFIINGNPHSLRRLRQEGFKTFDKWWDEGYDNELDLSKRIKKIIGVLNYLNSLSESDLITMRKDMAVTVAYNQSHFYKVQELNYYSLYNVIQNHL